MSDTTSQSNANGVASTGWFGSEARSKLLATFKPVPWYRKLWRCATNRVLWHEAREYNRIADRAFHKGNWSAFDAAVKLGDEAWAKLYKPNTVHEPHP